MPYNALAENIAINSSKTILQGKVPAELLVNLICTNDKLINLLIVVIEFLALFLSKNLLSLFVKKPACTVL